MESVRRELGASPPVVVGAYSVALLVSGLVAAPVGRHIDRHGARRAMTAGSIGAALGLAAFSQVTSVAGLYAAWAGLGAVMGLTLYEPAFASLALVFRADLRQAITVLTLAGGLASTVFWPLTQWLASSLGWRDAVLVLAAINLLVCVPLHALFLPGAGTAGRCARGRGGRCRGKGAARRRRALPLARPRVHAQHAGVRRHGAAPARDAAGAGLHARAGGVPRRARGADAGGRAHRGTRLRAPPESGQGGRDRALRVSRLAGGSSRSRAAAPG